MKLTHPRTKSTFLDVEVSLDSLGKIITSIYTKPTDSHNYINYNSCHQNRAEMAFLRIRRICSDEDDFVAKSRTMAYHFNLADYPDSLIQSSFERAYLQERDLLLEPKPDKIDSDEDRLFLITTHHPTYRRVNNIVNKNMELLDKSSSTRPILQTDLVQGFR